MKQSSSSVVISSSSVESVAEIKPNGYYKSNCPEGKKCNYVSTDYLNQEFLLDNKYGEILDSRDNKVYKTIEIEDQVWIAQNLNYASGKSSCYEYKTENCSRYGRLYTWAGAIDSLKIYREYGARCGYNQTGCGFLGEKWRGVCPLGWHLPTKAEFEKLLTNAHAWSRSAILKSNNSWHNDKGDDLFGIDSVGFSAVPGGFRFYNSEYDQLGLQAYFWSFTEFDYPNNAKAAYELFMAAVNEVVGLTSSISKGEALSVRCIKD
ncbi:MAG: FISUMP domain-containing protein [Fibrobacter sp.]|nr:FISUMP domain-containing protein [Fibrobacter sp.]MDY6370362.1 FISUMP domain-containing protein [Fibrobacter sp.]MDY6389790.1 FISUMP domain-containing protein [Fibrobacter sp.]